jgi:MarR family transcriptional regulator, negative regulator of the multidrug operon emrRAB
MHTSSVRTANLLGATALAVTDLMTTAGVSPSGAAALVLLHSTPGLSVTELGRRVGLTQSAAARMVDSLAGMVDRSRSGGREVSVFLTPRGKAKADELLTTRGEQLTDLLTVLDEHQRATLAELLGVLLAKLYERVGSTERLCRLCDRRSCTTDAVCPVGEAARR